MSQVKTKLENIYSKIRSNVVVAALIHDVKRSEVIEFAYSMAYVSLLGLVPSIAAVFGLVDLFTPFLGSNSGLIIEIRSFLIRHLAPTSGQLAANTISNLLDSLDFGNIGITGFVSLLITLVLLLANIEKAFNKIFEVEKHRNIITRFIHFWTFITLGTFVVCAGIGFFAGKLMDLDYIDPQSWWITMIVYRFSFFLLVFLLYKVVPNTYVKSKSAASGALLTVILFAIASSVFKLYPVYFTSLKMIYGALVALPLLLIWLHIVWVIVLFGAIFSHRLEMGFYVKKGNSLESSSYKDRYKSLEIRRQLPLSIFEFIYDSEKNPKGSSFDNVLKNFKSPVQWVEESIELLKELELVHRESNNGHKLYPNYRVRSDADEVLEQFEKEVIMKRGSEIDES